MTGTVLTWQQLRDLKRAEFEDAGDGWNEVSGRADADRTRTDKVMTAKLRETQESESATAAIARLERLSRNFQYIQTESGLIRTSLNALASELADPQRQLTQALADAAGRGFTVHEDGSIGYPAAVVCGNPQFGETGEKKVPGGTALGSSRFPLEPQPGLKEQPGFDYKPNPNAAMAQDIADRIVRAVNSATEIDERYARALRKLKAATGLDVTAATLKDVASDTAAVRRAAEDYLADVVPLDKSPAERKEWWDGLTEEQRQEYLDVAPDLVGSLDGIPALARDEANRNYLPVLIDSLEKRGDDDAQTKLGGLRAIEEKLNKPTVPPMYLLGIGDEGNGRAIIAYGNPDTAKNVSAYVPGLDTKLDEQFAGGTVKRAYDTALSAMEADRNSSTSSIVWLGYDAPQLTVDELALGDKNVMSDQHAAEGAPAYNEFMAGISATNEGEDPHVTAIGHSYGSLTVGIAANKEGGIPGADDIIIVGSPGTSADRAEDLNVGKDHVFVGAADNDIVTKLPNPDEASGIKTGAVGGASAGAVLGLGMGGPIGAGVGGLAGGVVGGFAGYSAQDAQTDPSQIYFGTDPAHKDFGGTRFLVDDGKPLIPGGVDAHSNYFSPTKDQMSADNIANIVVGKTDEISLERPR